MVRPNDDGIVKACGCGCTYTLKQYRMLHLVDVQRMYDGKRPSGIEIRQCRCGTPVIIGIDRGGNYDPRVDD